MLAASRHWSRWAPAGGLSHDYHEFVERDMITAGAKILAGGAGGGGGGGLVTLVVDW